MSRISLRTKHRKKINYFQYEEIDNLSIKKIKSGKKTIPEYMQQKYYDNYEQIILNNKIQY